MSRIFPQLQPGVCFWNIPWCDFSNHRCDGQRWFECLYWVKFRGFRSTLDSLVNHGQRSVFDKGNFCNEERQRPRWSFTISDFTKYLYYKLFVAPLIKILAININIIILLIQKLELL